MNTTRLDLVGRRNRLADLAYDDALAAARRPLGDPKRVPYPTAVKAALAAYDAVIEQYRPMLWPEVTR